MIEKRIIDYLFDTLKISVYAEVPAGNHGKFLVVEKTGSYRENLLDEATIVIQSYDESLFKAATLNTQVKAAMFEMVHEHNISGVRLNSDYNNTDTTTKRYRYQAVFVVTYY